MFFLSLKMNACMKWKDAELFIFPTFSLLLFAKGVQKVQRKRKSECFSCCLRVHNNNLVCKLFKILTFQKMCTVLVQYMLLLLSQVATIQFGVLMVKFTVLLHLNRNIIIYVLSPFSIREPFYATLFTAFALPQSLLSSVRLHKILSMYFVKLISFFFTLSCRWKWNRQYRSNTQPSSICQWSV